MTQAINNGIENGAQQLGLVWIDCPYPVATIGLARIIEGVAKVHVGRKPPTEESSPSIILGMDGMEGLPEALNRVRTTNPDSSILVFGLHLDLPLARAALQAGARGFIHAAMQPRQIIRAIKVAAQGEIVAPRELLEYVLMEDHVDLHVLSARQREILELVTEGSSNAQIAKTLFLTESTVKQHLRAAYKSLGVKNRTEAAGLLRNGA
jgi:DNA-binding NarL/FixJ family response regulator